MRIVKTVLRFLRKIPPFLQLLYLVRFSLVAVLFLVLFPIVSVTSAKLSALFLGLFDLDTPLRMFWATCFAYLLSWSALITMRITLLYGPTRCGLQKLGVIRNTPKRDLRPHIFFVTGLILPIPFLFVSLREATRWEIYLGAGIGVVAALVIVIVADLLQRLFNSYSTDEPFNDEAKRLFLPFQTRWSNWAEKKRVTAFPASGFWGWINKLIARLYPDRAVGFLTKEGENVAVNPGIVLATATLLIYFSLYFFGFVFWTDPVICNGLPCDIGMSAITYLFVLVTLLSWMLAGAAFVLDRYRVPTLLAVLVLLYFATLDHRVETFPSAQTAMAPTPASILESRKDLPYMIVIAANGGGIQSAAWTAEILTRFLEECNNPRVDPISERCTNAITLMSGVSGGSVGLMYFLEAFDKRADPNSGKRIREYSRRSSLAYAGGGFVFNDLVRNIPFASSWLTEDRGSQLAKGWIDNKNRVDCESPLVRGDGELCKAGYEPGKLSELRSRLSDGTRPAVIFNATVVETGKRLLFSTAKLTDVDPEINDWQTFDSYSGGRDINVTDAVRLSAAFPIVSPASRLSPLDETRPYHINDGGYFDNYGLLSVRDFMAEGLKQYKGLPNPTRKKIIVLQLYGEGVDLDPTSGADRRTTSDGSSWLSQALAPLTTLIEVRQTAQFTRNDDAWKAIEVMACESGYEAHRLVFEFPKSPAPLSWHLTGQEVKNIDSEGEAAFRGDPKEKNRQQWDRFVDLLTRPETVTNPCKVVEQKSSDFKRYKLSSAY